MDHRCREKTGFEDDGDFEFTFLCEKVRHGRHQLVRMMR